MGRGVTVGTEDGEAVGAGDSVGRFEGDADQDGALLGRKVFVGTTLGTIEGG